MLFGSYGRPPGGGVGGRPEGSNGTGVPRGVPVAGCCCPEGVKGALVGAVAALPAVGAAALRKASWSRAGSTVPAGGEAVGGAVWPCARRPKPPAASRSIIGRIFFTIILR